MAQHRRSKAGFLTASFFWGNRSGTLASLASELGCSRGEALGLLYSSRMPITMRWADDDSRRVKPVPGSRELERRTLMLDRAQAIAALGYPMPAEKKAVTR